MTSLGWFHGNYSGDEPMALLGRHGAPLTVFVRSVAAVAGVSILKVRKWFGIERGRVSQMTCDLIEATLRRREASFVDTDVDGERSRRMVVDAQVVGVELRNLLCAWKFRPRCYPSLHAPLTGDAERLPTLPEAPCVIEIDAPALRLVVPPLRIGTPRGDAIRTSLRGQIVAWRQSQYQGGTTTT